MKKIFVYGFEGFFNGKSEFEYTYPEIGATHNCMLFISQPIDELSFEHASIEIARYGFENINNLRGGSMNIETLNTDTYRGFSAYYEEALQEGSSIVYYPNT